MGMYITHNSHSDFAEEIHCELLVVGGGVAGVTAAIAAAREGVRTVLVQNRPVLGGVSSVELSEGNGRYVNGASNYIHRNARECGLIEELKNSNAWHYVNGYDACWSQVLREAVEKEKNITLLMNTEALSVGMDNQHIRFVKARGMGCEINYTIFADYFIDASGDGFFATAGAEFRMGREGKDEFHESLAPDKPDAKTMGSSIAFKAFDAGHPVPFKAPAGAYHFESDDDLPFRDHSSLTYGYWWLEYGGELDTIRDDAKIYKTLRDILYGIWDHVKNGGDHGAANYVISWLSPIAGKRESRRFVGDVMLTQNDIVENRDFPDAVAYGGWPFDIHPPEGIFSHGHPGCEPPFIFPPLYTIPFRALYSRNIDNLLMAGRNISVTHVALGTTRVMATCALCGQAVGTAVSLLEKHSCTPRELFQGHLAELRSLLQKNDLLIPNRPVRLDDDLVKSARLQASSTLSFRMMPPDGSEPLQWQPKVGYDPCDMPPEDRRKGQIFTLCGTEIKTIEVLMDNASAVPVEVTARLREPDGNNDLAVAAAKVPAGPGHVIRFDFNLANLQPGRYMLIFDPHKDVSFETSRVHLPGIHRKGDGCYHNFNNMVFNILPAQQPYPIENLHNDFGRYAEKSPSIWISEEGFPQTVTLQWNAPVSFKQLDLVFDTNLDEFRYNQIPPECVRDFRVEAEINGTPTTIVDETDNFQRFRRFDFPQQIMTSKICVQLLASNGGNCARLYGIHVYA